MGRLVKMAEKIFGTKPLVFSLPYQQKISPEDSQAGHITVLLVGNTDSSAVQRIVSAFEAKGFFWVNVKPKLSATKDGYGLAPQATPGSKPEDWLRIGPAQVDTHGIFQLPTDTWPFLYLYKPMIPMLNIRWMVMVLVLSGLVLYRFTPVRELQAELADVLPRRGVHAS